MSSTNRGAKRIEGDAYQTPPKLADFLVRKLVEDELVSNSSGVVLEPHAGDGAFVMAIRKHMDPTELVANELIHDLPREVYCRQQCDASAVFADFADMGKHWDGGNWHAIIGNPPYSLAEAHIRHALSIIDRHFGTVAFLLRLAFLESRARLAFWREHPPAKVYVLAERPSFTGGQTDSSAYGFFVWTRPWEGKKEARMEIVSWKGEPAKKVAKADPQEPFPNWPE